MRLPVAVAEFAKRLAAHTIRVGDISAFLAVEARTVAAITIMLLDLMPAGSVEAGLLDALPDSNAHGRMRFDIPDDARSHARMQAVDELNRRFGRGAVGFGTAGERQKWTLRREFISPRYTTAWAELLHV